MNNGYILKNIVILMIGLFLMEQIQAKNLIKNSEFDNGMTSWYSGYIATNEGVVVTISVDTNGVLSGKNCMKQDIENGGANTYSIQRTQSLPLKAGLTYQLSFLAMFEGDYASVDIEAVFEINVEPWTRYLNKTVTLYQEPTKYSLKYPDEDDDPIETDIPNTELKFFTGGTNNVIIYPDSIVVDDGLPESDIDFSQNAIQPSIFSLEQNYPNPFNAATKIEYSIEKAGPVQLKIFDLAGREIRKLVQGNEMAGKHTVYFNAGELPSGVYFYQLRAAGLNLVKKMIFMK
jgi:hypothetical protein